MTYVDIEQIFINSSELHHYCGLYRIIISLTLPSLGSINWKFFTEGIVTLPEKFSTYASSAKQIVESTEDTNIPGRWLVDETKHIIAIS